MNTSNQEFLFVYAELEHQIKQILNEPTGLPRSTHGETTSEPKLLNGYESAMRSHAAGCEAGR
jgi:hypothetical protein